MRRSTVNLRQSKVPQRPGKRNLWPENGVLLIYIIDDVKVTSSNCSFAS